jgi:hypothetical protein
MNKFIKLIVVIVLVFVFAVLGSKVSFSQAVWGDPSIHDTGEDADYPYSGSVSKTKDKRGLYEVYRYNKVKRDYCNEACKMEYYDIERMEKCQKRNEAQRNELKGQCTKYLDDDKNSCLIGCLSESLTDEIGVKKSNNKGSIYRD